MSGQSSGGGNGPPTAQRKEASRCKAALADAAKEAFSTQGTVTEDQETLKALEAQFVHVVRFDADGAAAFARLIQPMYDEYAESARPDGRALLDSLRAGR